MMMNREDVIKLAIENTISGLKFDEDGLVRFAKLVAQHERERIAKKIEQLPFGDTAASFSVYVREA
jgi:hypothetical protein